MLHRLETIGMVQDALAGMMGDSLRGFTNPFFPRRNIDTVFKQFHNGLDNTRKILGENGYRYLNESALKAKKFFLDGDYNSGKLVFKEMYIYIGEKKYRQT